MGLRYKNYGLQITNYGINCFVFKNVVHLQDK